MEQEQLTPRQKAALAYAARLVERALDPYSTDDNFWPAEHEQHAGDIEFAWLTAAHAAEIAATFLVIATGFQGEKEPLRLLRQHRDDLLFDQDGEAEDGRAD